MATRDDLSKILGRVRALIERADHANTPVPEASACRAKAEELMRKYRIEEEELLATDAGASEPISIQIEVCEFTNPEYSRIYGIVHAVAMHAGCRIGNKWRYDADKGDHMLVVTVVGYEGDARFAEMLYTSARLVWSTRVQPEVDPSLSDAENVYNLRSAGIERWRIAQMMWQSDPKDGTAHGRVSTIYKRECERRGEDPRVSGRNVNAKTYRKLFSEQFVGTLRTRLHEARQAADKADRPMVLHGRDERVAEAFYQLFPDQRPSNVPAKQDDKVPARRQRTRRTDTQAARAAYQRRYLSPTAQAARAAGREAAEAIDLRTGPSVQRVGTQATFVDGDVVDSNRELGC